jgi:hypothetical protein
MTSLYYDREGRPASQEEWRQLSRQPGYSRISYADRIVHGRQVTVITCWLGTASADHPGGLLLFHTYADVRRPGDPRPSYQRLWGWPILQVARAGHEAVTAWLTGVAAWLAGETSQLPGPPPGRPVSPAGARR